MLGLPTQANRLIKISVSGLDEDELLLRSFSGHEGISRLYHYELVMYSLKPDIDFDQVIGQPATLTITLDDQNSTPRSIHGILSAFCQGPAHWVTLPDTEKLGFAEYRATLVPALWMLTRQSDCRIFQNLAVPDIIREIVNKYSGIQLDDSQLRGHHPQREYCVQYRETDFNFISRLMEEEGICYFFADDDRQQKVVLADNLTAFPPCPVISTLSYTEKNQINEWNLMREIRPDLYTLQDYNFEQPATSLLSNTPPPKAGPTLEIYDYPGEYSTKDEGATLAQVRLEEETVPQVVINGSGHAASLTSGFKFTLQDHYREDQNADYTVIYVYHSCEQGENFYTTGPQARQDFTYFNRFQCIPNATPYRPPRVTPEPVMRGTQTAVVVGPAGEEIYTDQYGRVKVQFYWDRLGKSNENSSCWIRVSQPWAGKNWGAMWIPRIGQEVIVSFLEGDPDRPLITGRVYNAVQMPPYKLPDNMTRSTFQSRSSKGGSTSNYNELRFEDKQGAEQIFMNAERDLDLRVERDAREYVGHARHLIVDGSQFEQVNASKHLHIKGEHIEKIEQDASIHVLANRREQVDQSQSLTVGGNRMEQIAGNQSLTVGSNRMEQIGGSDSRSVTGDVKELIGGSCSLILTGDQKEAIAGSVSREILGEIKEAVAGNASLAVAQSYHQTAVMSSNLTAGMSINLQGGLTVNIEAGEGVSIVGPGGFISIGPEGVVIQGTMVLINSGGAPGTCSSASPAAPDAADVPDAPAGPVAPADPTDPDTADDGSQGGKLN